MSSPAWATGDRRKLDIQPRPETVAALAELAEVHTMAELRKAKGYRSAKQGLS